VCVYIYIHTHIYVYIERGGREGEGGMVEGFTLTRKDDTILDIA